MLVHGMNEKITWVDKMDTTLSIFHENEDSVIYQLNSERLLKVYKNHVSNDKKEQITKVVQYFLNHPYKRDIVPINSTGYFHQHRY